MCDLNFLHLDASPAPASARVADARANSPAEHGGVFARRHANGSVLRDDGDGEDGESHRREEDEGGFEEHGENSWAVES